MKTFLVFLAIIAVSTASDINLNELCRGILFASLPHPADQNLFIGCIQGKGTVFGCNDPDEVFDSSQVACVTNKIPSNPGHEELCEEFVSGWFPHEEFCELYIVCEFSKPNVRQCPENSIFFPALPGCIPGDRVTCEFDNSSSEPTTTEATSQTTVSTEPTTPTTTSTIPSIITTSNPNDVNISFVCPPLGGFIPNQTNCSRYFECILGVRHARTCEDDQIFDVITSQCGDRSTSLCAVNIRCV